MWGHSCHQRVPRRPHASTGPFLPCDRRPNDTSCLPFCLSIETLPLPQAFVLYEEAIPDSRQEVRALHSIMGTLNRWVGSNLIRS